MVYSAHAVSTGCRIAWVERCKSSTLYTPDIIGAALRTEQTEEREYQVRSVIKDEEIGIASDIETVIIRG